MEQQLTDKEAMSMWLAFLRRRFAGEPKGTTMSHRVWRRSPFREMRRLLGE